MKKEVEIVLFGLGPMGKLLAKAILEKKGFKIVGVVERTKDFVGKDLGEVLELDKTIGVSITDDTKELVARGARAMYACKRELHSL